MQRVCCLLALGLLLWVTPLHADVRFVPARYLQLAISPANDAPICKARMWVSTDRGRHWQDIQTDGGRPTSLPYAAPADGRYDFYIVLSNDAGDSAPPPTAGAEPHVTVIVDTTAPLLQLHGASRVWPDADRPGLLLRASVIEENLGPESIRVSYRPAGTKDWFDGGTAPLAAGRIQWLPPLTLDGPLDLRVVVTDLAGHRGTDELLGIPWEGAPRHPAIETTAVRSTQAKESPTKSPAKTRPESPDAAQPMGTPPVVAPVKPPNVERVTFTGDTAKPASPKPSTQPETVPDTDTGDDATPAETLRSLAADYEQRGRRDLAIERLAKALKTDPRDPQLLVDFASVLYRAGRYEEADDRFAAALTLDPEHTSALEGLALVAATERRYPQAREHLEHLLRLDPRSALNWRRLGDIEHKLGHRTQAIEAWQRVLELAENEPALRKSAQQRLDYFGRQRGGGATNRPNDQKR